MRTGAILLLGLLACSDAGGLVGQDPSIVVGSWEWSTACCSFAGQARTPATEGYGYVLQYSPDGRVEAFRDGVLVSSTHFTVKQSKPDPLADPITSVEYDAPLQHGPAIPAASKQMVFRTENGTLVLRNLECADCYGEWQLLPRLTNGG